MGNPRYNKRVRDAQRCYLVVKRGGKCEGCGVILAPQHYDWHAPYGHTDRRVSKLLGGNLKRLEAEAKQCIMLCPQCHRAEHMEAGNALSPSD